MQAAAVQWREQQGYGQAPSPAPAPAPPPAAAAGARRTSTMNNSSGTGGRMRSKATDLGNIFMETAVRKEPVMSMGPTLEPGGIVRGRDRGFANNREFLDESSFCEPKLFTEQQLWNSGASVRNSVCNNEMRDNSLESYGFSTPGAFNETEEGNGYVTRERRESSWNSAPIPAILAGTGRRRDSRVSEQGFPSEPLVTAGNLRRGTTNESRNQRAAYQRQPNREESWTGRSLYMQGSTHRQSSMMSVTSDISMPDCWLGSCSVEDPDFVPYDDDMNTSQRSSNSIDRSRRRSSDAQHPSEPSVPITMRRSNTTEGNSRSVPIPMRRSNTAEGSSRRRGLKSGDSSRGRASLKSTSSSSFSNTSQSLLGGFHQDEGDEDSKEFLAVDPPEPDKRTSNLKEPPKPSEDAYQHDQSGGTSLTSSRRQRISTSSTAMSSSLHRSARLEPTIPEEMGNHSESTNNSNRKPDPPGEMISNNSRRSSIVASCDRSQSPPPPLADFESAVRDRSTSPSRNGEDQLQESQTSNDEQFGKARGRARATRPGVVHVSAEEPSSGSTSVQEPDSKVRRFTASHPGAVSVSNASSVHEPDSKVRRSTAVNPGAVSMSSASTVEEPTIHPEPDAKVRRAPATRPGVVSVSNTPAEPDFQPAAAKSASGPDVKVRHAPASRPGVVSVSETYPNEPETSEPGGLQFPAFKPDVKIRRTAATIPGAVSVSSEKPLVEPDSLDTSQQQNANEPFHTTIGVPSARKGQHGLRGSQRGIVGVTDKVDAALREAKEKEKTGRSLKFFSRPTSPTRSRIPPVSRDSIPPQLTSLDNGKDSKVRRSPAVAPGAVSVTPEEPSLCSASLDNSQQGQPSASEPNQRVGVVNSSVDAALREAKEREKAGRSLKFFSRPTSPTRSLNRPRIPSISGDSLPPRLSSIDNGKDSKVRRSPATAPGAVSVSPEEPIPSSASMETSQQSQQSASVTNQLVGMANSSVDAALREVKEREKAGRSLKFFAKPSLTPPKPSVSGTETSLLPKLSKIDDGKDSKVRRTHATAPGAVSVTPEEPSAGMDSSKKSNSEPQNGSICVPSAKQGRRGLGSSQLGAGSIANSVDAALREEKEREKAGKSLKFFANQSSISPTGVPLSPKSSGADAKVRLAPATVPGAVSVAKLEPQTESVRSGASNEAQLDSTSVSSARQGRCGLGASQHDASSITNSIDEALREEKMKERGNKTIQYFANKPGTIRATNSEDDKMVGDAGSSADADTGNSKDKGKLGLGRIKATCPGVVHVTGSEQAGEEDSKCSNSQGVGALSSEDESSAGGIKITNSADTQTRDKKEKEKNGRGLKKATTPGVVHVTSSDAEGNQKDSKTGKGLKFGRPGAVSITSPDEGSETKKFSGLMHKTSSLTASDGGDLDDVAENGADIDPTMETPEDDQTNDKIDASMASQPRSRSPARGSDALRGFPTNVAPPIKDRKSSDSKTKKKGFFGKMFKSKKGKKSVKGNEDLRAFEEEKARMGTAATAANL